jgi:hypothetical protein
MTGYEDLDRYGSWRDDSEYGPMWMPTVASNWVPYRDGRWTWIAPVGLDLGRQRAVGLCALPLRPLGASETAGPGPRAA